MPPLLDTAVINMRQHSLALWDILLALPPLWSTADVCYNNPP
jgi:hypothetical protein